MELNIFNRGPNQTFNWNGYPATERSILFGMAFLVLALTKWFESPRQSRGWFAYVPKPRERLRKCWKFMPERNLYSQGKERPARVDA